MQWIINEKEPGLKHLLFSFVLFAVLLGQASGQESPFVKSFLSKTEKLRKSLEAEFAKSETVFLEEFRKLKELTLAEIEVARKAKTASDDLDGAIALRDVAKEVDSITWLSAKSAKLKKVEWEFKNRNGNRLVKQGDGKWVESADESLVWIEKQRNDDYILLYEPRRDLVARLYADIFFFQSATTQKEGHWESIEGKWIR